MLRIMFTLLCLTFAACGTGAEDNGKNFTHPTAATASFEATSCWVDMAEEAQTDCGWLTVPERWDRPGTRTLKLPVVIYQPREPDPDLAPVIFLSGGPGYPATGPDGGEHIQGWRGGADYLFPSRVLIVFDQRGSGLGFPRLTCPEAKDPAFRWDLSTDPEDFGDRKERLRAAYVACRDRLLSMGHDLAAFNSRQSAADVEALRRTLGFEQVVLFGISYGTRLALTVMRHYPENVSAAVLDSVIPPNTPWIDQFGEAYGATIDRLFAACAAHERCHRAYPDLKDNLLAVIDALARTPLVIEVENRKGREPLYARIDHHDFIEILRNEMYVSAHIAKLPILIAGMAKGEHWRLEAHAENVIYGDFPRKYDIGMSSSVYCHDRASEPKETAAMEGDHAFLNAYKAWIEDQDLCADWPSGIAGTEAATAVTSDIPSLLLAGALDASTPVEFAETAAETLSVSHLFVFPANAHEQIWRGECPRQILWDFLADPEIRPNPDCLHSLRQPAFLVLGGG